MSHKVKTGMEMAHSSLARIGKQMRKENTGSSWWGEAVRWIKGIVTWEGGLSPHLLTVC